MNFVLIYFAIKYKGYFHDVFDAIKNKEFIPIAELEKIRNQIENGELKVITIIDEDYPKELKNINNPPIVLFYKGNKKLLDNKKILLTGEFINEDIEKFVDDSIEQISKDRAIITNYSKGVDELIINSALEKSEVKLIFVSPNGLEEAMFADNEKINEINENQYLILSEYPNGSVVNKKRLTQRNRISVGLSESLVIASSKKDNRLIQSLVTNALNQGKDVFCFPGLQNDDDGNNLLIQDGAIMVTSIKNTIN